MNSLLRRLLFPWLFWIYALLFILPAAFEFENCPLRYRHFHKRSKITL